MSKKSNKINQVETAENVGGEIMDTVQDAKIKTTVVPAKKGFGETLKGFVQKKPVKIAGGILLAGATIVGAFALGKKSGKKKDNQVDEYDEYDYDDYNAEYDDYDELDDEETETSIEEVQTEE